MPIWKRNSHCEQAGCLEGDPSPPECWRRLKSRGSLKQSENLYTTSDKTWIWEVLTIQQLQTCHVKQPAEKNNFPIVLAPHSIVVCGQSHPSGGVNTNSKKTIEKYRPRCCGGGEKLWGWKNGEFILDCSEKLHRLPGTLFVMFLSAFY